MQDINSRLFDWQNDPFSDQTIISATAEASELGRLRAHPGVPWPVQFKMTGTKGDCVMELCPPDDNPIDGMTYLGYYDGNVIRVSIFND